MALLSTPLQTFQSTPPATKAIGLIILLSSLIFQYLYYVQAQASPVGLVDTAATFPYIVMVPGSWMWYPWTIITSSFVETRVLEFIFTLIFVPSSLQYFERLWGTTETVKFVLVTVGVSNVISLFINYLEYFVLGSEFFLTGMYYSGQMALQAGCLVAFTQIIPEHQVQLFGFIKLRVKQLPMLYVGISNVLCIIGYQSPYILIQWGWLVAWIYLRFYKKTSIEGSLSGTSETWGDRSETFAFVYWFPPPVHGPLGKVTDFVYNNAVKLKLVRPYPSTDLEAGGYAPVGSVNARAEAERRRAMALKALDQRMANAATAPSAPMAKNPSAPSSAPQEQPGVGSSRAAEPMSATNSTQETS